MKKEGRTVERKQKVKRGKGKGKRVSEGSHVKFHSASCCIAQIQIGNDQQMFLLVPQTTKRRKEVMSC